MSETNPYQELLEQLQACENQHERDWLSLRFSMAQLPEVLQAAVRASAVPRFFDHAFLNALLDQPLDEERFTRFLEQSYIEPYPGEGRYNVHERNRKLLQERLWQEDEALYRKISGRAFVYCQEQDQEDTTWRIETIYHQLIVDPENGVRTFDNTCVKWIAPPYVTQSKVESLLRAVQDHLELTRIQETAAHWFWLNQARLARVYLRFQDAKKALQHIPRTAQYTDPCLVANSLKTLGDSHRYLSELQDARECYEAALTLYREKGNQLGEAECLLRFGEAYLGLSDFFQAEQCYNEALALYRNIENHSGEAECLKFLGHIYLHLAEYQKALLLYKEALNLYRVNNVRLGEADCLRTLGNVYCSFLKFHDAQQCCEEALRLYREINAPLGEANSLKALGQVHMKCCDFSGAQQCYDHSLMLYRKLGLKLGEADCLRSFGDLKVQVGDWPSAQKYYEQALVLSENIQRPEGVAECLEGFAELYQAQGQHQQAEEYWQKAAGKYNELSMPLRAEQCLEQVRQLKEQDNESSKQKNKNS